MLVRPHFGDSGARRQHQPHQPGGSAGDAAGGRGHVQSSRWSPPPLTPPAQQQRGPGSACDHFLLCPPAETGLERRHMAFCGLFGDTLALLNGVGVSTGEALVARVITWLDRKGRGFPILPLLTACSRCLASVRHMTRIMEACITAYFNHGS